MNVMQWRARESGAHTRSPQTDWSLVSKWLWGLDICTISSSSYMAERSYNDVERKWKLYLLFFSFLTHIEITFFQPAISPAWHFVFLFFACLPLPCLCAILLVGKFFSLALASLHFMHKQTCWNILFFSTSCDAFLAVFILAFPFALQGECCVNGIYKEKKLTVEALCDSVSKNCCKRCPF